MKRFATALLAVLTLSACAVTGQPAHPGTAAIYDGATITTAQVAAWGTAQDDMGYPNDPGAALTLLLLRPALDKEAATQGIVFDDKQISAEAQTWMSASKAKVVSPTPDMMEVVRTVRVLHALLLTTSGKAAIKTAVESIEANAEANPVYGHFTVVQFANSFDIVAKRYQNDQGQYGDMVYLVFKDLSGFNGNAQRGWMVGAGLPSPSPTASPTASPAPVNASPAPASPSPTP
ncbi:hypothetical protein [Demequina lutea]|uniref:Lipoprotein n=1 Tax=Demequina lutea TaxID=431489 RepID=A0A7Z0CL23_9MICO|nr:hypothetical protein [Demequina lutea]NYI42315.1 hypothetical protein [Demequina lutea]